MRYILISILVLSIFQQSHGQNANLGSKLQQWLAQQPAAEQQQTIMITFAEQVPTVDLLHQYEKNFTPLDQRAQQILSATKALSARTQALYLPQFERIKAMPGASLDVISFFSIANAVEITANAFAINALQRLTGVLDIELSAAYAFILEKPSNEAPSVESPNGREQGLSVIGAPTLWQMGYTGRSKKAMLVDTGVWPDHPAIQGKFLGNRLGLSSTWLGYDEVTPRDKVGTHGTHVIGTVLGLDTATNDTIGVAFGAYFIATDPIVTDISQVKPWSELIRAFEWAINPDGDSTTTSDIPDVINNSWGRANTGMDSLCGHPMIVQAFSAVEAAGIANVFSAGNNGPGVSTGGVPAQLVLDTLNLFAVGALDGNNAALPIAGFSSRGPTTCPAPGTSLAIKPEVSAPGVNVRSADGRSGYGTKSGTSMAAPHVSGAVLLLKEAFPNLSGRQILNALYQTAVDLGDPGEDNVFGRGLINLPAAFNFLAATHTPTPPASRAYDLAIAGIDSPATHQLGQDCSAQMPQISRQQFRVKITNVGDSTVNGFWLFYQLSGGLTDSISSTQSLAPGQSTLLTTPSLALQTSGWAFPNRLALEVRAFQSVTESDLINNRWVLEFPTRDGQNLPLLETFDTTRLAGQARLNDWTIRDLTGDDRTWQFYPVQGAATTTFAAGMRMRDVALRLGQLDELITPPLYFPPMQPGAAARPLLQFQMAYASRTGNFRDSLTISVSWDCGQTFVPVYSTGGDSMRTFQGVNPSLAAHWRAVAVDHPLLSPMQSNTAVYLKFTSKSDFGGNLYLTNISYLDQGMSLPTIMERPTLQLFPNPTGDFLQINAGENTVYRIEVIDVLGRQHLRKVLSDGEHALQLSVETLPPGTYLLKADTQQGPIVQRFIKK